MMRHIHTAGLPVLQYFTQLVEGELAGGADAWSYAAMALAYRRGRQHEAVLQIYGEMRERGMPVYKDVHFGVLEACERLGLWNEGREVLRYIQVGWPVLCGVERGQDQETIWHLQRVHLKDGQF